MRIALSLCLLLYTVAAQAEIYTWTDGQGVRHYSDSAVSGNAERADLPGIQAVDGDPDALARLQAQLDGSSGDSGQALPDGRTPRLVQPQAEATFRDSDGAVPLSVTIGGAGDLRSGEQITYYLDGSPIPQSPTDQTRLQLGNVPRGTHTISAALLFRGREIRRTEPVTFYMKPPAAISPLNRNQGGNQSAGSIPGATVAPPAGNTAGVPAAPRVNTTSAAAGAAAQ